MVEGVPSRDVPLIWGRCAELLEPALARFEHPISLSDLYWSLRGCQRQLWIAWSYDSDEIVAAVVTELVRYGESPSLVCRVPWIGGRQMASWVAEALDLLKRWARSHGCRFMEGSGRRGWKKYGFEERGLSSETGLPILVLDLAEA